MKKKKDIVTYEVEGIFLSYSSQLKNGISFNYAYSFLDTRLNFEILRNEKDVINYFSTIIENFDNKKVPVLCTFGASKTLTPLIERMAEQYCFSLFASNRLDWICLDLMNSEGVPVLRFYDVKKLVNCDISYFYELQNKNQEVLDFRKIRTPKTPLTLGEQSIMHNDCLAILEFLDFLCQQFDFIDFNDFGNKIFTMPSIARQYARYIASARSFFFENGKSQTYLNDWVKICQQNKFKNWTEYAYAKASYRGGLAFTSPKTTHKILRNVQKLDVCSCFHAFLTGKRYPVKFEKWSNAEIRNACDYIKNLKIKDILKNYDEPFNFYFNARVKFYNLKIKDNMPAILSAEKLQDKKHLGDVSEFRNNETRLKNEKAVRQAGFKDSVTNPTFAYNKIYACDEGTFFINEIEFYLICLCYDFKKYEVKGGFGTIKTLKPHGYIVLQSLHFFSKKEELKTRAKNDPLAGETLTIFKKLYNSIYGSQVQDAFQASYEYVPLTGEFLQNENELPNALNFDELNKNKFYKNIFNMGARIGGWSRLHLIIAIFLLQEKCGSKIEVLSGDTDSLYIKTTKDITASDLIAYLKPLHQATTRGIFQNISRVLKSNIDFECKKFLQKVGKFEIEKENIPYHFEFWNKTRLSVNKNLKCDLTCSGLPQPANMFNLADFINEMLERYCLDKSPEKIEKIINKIMKYNTILPYEMCYISYPTAPYFFEKVDGRVFDYLGNFENLEQVHKTLAYTGISTVLGDTSYISNRTNIKYLKFINCYNKNIDNTTIINDDGVFTIDYERIL